MTAFESDKQVISGSPITRDITGEEFYSTIYSVRESPLKEGLIWVGANDGPVHVTYDGGKNWKDVTPNKNIKGGRVDSVEPSNHNPSKAFVTILRYQLGDWKPYIYRTYDNGDSWDLITKGIPEDYPVRVLREDPKKEGLLFAGTEFGMFVSFDDGNNWQSFQQNLPVTPITDIKIHRNDIVLSTMGRSFWIMDNISYLRTFSFSDNQILYPIENTIRYRNRPLNNNHVSYPQTSVDIDYKILNELDEEIFIKITDLQDNVINSYVSSDLNNDDIENYEMSTNEFTYILNNNISKVGVNRFKWDMRHRGSWNKDSRYSYRNGPLVKPGKYKVTITIDGVSFSENLEIISDPRIDLSSEVYEEQEKILLEIRDFMTEVRFFENEVSKILINKPKNKKYLSISKKLNTEKGTYMQPMLIDQIRYLQSMLRRADQKPGEDAINRLKELKSEFYILKNKLG